MKATFWLDKSKKDYVLHLGKIIKEEDNMIKIEIEYDEYDMGAHLTRIFFAGVNYGIDRCYVKPLENSKP